MTFLDPNLFYAARQRMEAMTLLWIAHPDFEIREKALETLKKISNERIRNITKGIINLEAPFIIDLLKMEKDSKERKWFDPLTSFLKQYSDVCHFLKNNNF